MRRGLRERFDDDRGQKLRRRGGTAAATAGARHSHESSATAVEMSTLVDTGCNDGHEDRGQVDVGVGGQGVCGGPRQGDGRHEWAMIGR